MRGALRARIFFGAAVSFAALAAQWPILLAYIISFIQISLAWHEHHDTFVRVEIRDRNGKKAWTAPIDVRAAK